MDTKKSFLPVSLTSLTWAEDEALPAKTVDSWDRNHVQGRKNLSKRIHDFFLSPGENYIILYFSQYRRLTYCR